MRELIWVDSQFGSDSCGDGSLENAYRTPLPVFDNHISKKEFVKLVFLPTEDEVVYEEILQKILWESCREAVC